jgi:hypothetical protein
LSQTHWMVELLSQQTCELFLSVSGSVWKYFATLSAVVPFSGASITWITISFTVRRVPAGVFVNQRAGTNGQRRLSVVMASSRRRRRVRYVRLGATRWPRPREDRHGAVDDEDREHHADGLHHLDVDLEEMRPARERVDRVGEVQRAGRAEEHDEAAHRLRRADLEEAAEEAERARATARVMAASSRRGADCARSWPR